MSRDGAALHRKLVRMWAVWALLRLADQLARAAGSPLSTGDGAWPPIAVRSGRLASAGRHTPTYLPRFGGAFSLNDARRSHLNVI